MNFNDYRPPFYQRLRAGGVPNAYTSISFDKQAFIKACLQSETSSVTIDLSSEKKIRSLAVQIENFHPVLVDAISKWVNDSDKERARDCVHISGWLPGQTPRTASQEMWDNGYTFMDVICEAQRHNLNFQQHSNCEAFLSVSYALPDQRGVFVRNKPIKDNLNMFSKVIDSFLGGLLKQISSARKKQKMQRVLDRTKADELKQKNVLQNRNILRAEQVVRECSERLDDFAFANKLMNEYLHECQSRVERDREMYEPIKSQIEQLERRIKIIESASKSAEPVNIQEQHLYEQQIYELNQQRMQYLEELNRVTYDEVDIHGSIVRVEFSREAQIMRKIKLDENYAILLQITKNYEEYKVFARQCLEQLTALRLGDSIEVVFKFALQLQSPKPDELVEFIIKASKNTEHVEKKAEELGDFKELISARDEYDYAISKKQYIDEYINFRIKFNDFASEIENQKDNALRNNKTHSFTKCAKSCINAAEQLTNLAKNSTALNDRLLEDSTKNKFIQTLQSLENLTVTSANSNSFAINIDKLEQISQLTKQLDNIVENLSEQDDIKALEQNPEQHRIRLLENAEQANKKYLAKLAECRPLINEALVQSIADRAVTVNRMQMAIRERITPEMLRIDHEIYERQSLQKQEPVNKKHIEQHELDEIERM